MQNDVFMSDGYTLSSVNYEVNYAICALVQYTPFSNTN